jgi:geranylgeranyl diphosphate synthase type II
MATLSQISSAFTEYLAAQKENGQPRELYEPIEYILSLGGKRVRPLLVLIGTELFDGNKEDALPAAMAVEYFHNFSLLHDDIMDVAPLRRGQPTVHEKWNSNVAILSGDAMLVRAYQWLMHIPDRHCHEVMRLFNKTAIEVCEGQQLDMNFETRNDVTVEEYLHMISFKTSVLLASSLAIGARIAGANEQQINLCYEYALHLGIGFQLQDDYLDLYGHPDKVGKQVGGDILANKKTYLVLRALEKGNEQQRAALKALMANSHLTSDQKVYQAKALLEELDIPAEVQKMIGHYFEKAKAIQKNLALNPEKDALLTELYAMVTGRES